jgi:hypothetical protein
VPSSSSYDVHFSPSSYVDGCKHRACRNSLSTPLLRKNHHKDIPNFPVPASHSHAMTIKSHFAQLYLSTLATGCRRMLREVNRAYRDSLQIPYPIRDERQTRQSLLGVPTPRRRNPQHQHHHERHERRLHERETEPPRIASPQPLPEEKHYRIECPVQLGVAALQVEEEWKETTHEVATKFHEGSVGRLGYHVQKGWVRM